MSSREEILANIKRSRKAKNQEIDLAPEPVASGLRLPEGDLALAFKQALEAVQGECYIFDNRDDCVAGIQTYLREKGATEHVFTSPSLAMPLAKQLGKKATELSQIQAGISPCEVLAAQTGTAILSAREGRRLISFSPIHIIIAQRSQLRSSLDEAVKDLAQKYGKDFPSQITLITGPSRTADIEKTLILGAHGPKNLAVFIYK